MNSQAIIFIVSLPRSGSTLLQRILGAHSEVSTVSEPWILLPALSALRKEGVLAEYNHDTLNKAILGFCDVLPNKKEDYYQAVRNFAEELYKKASKGNTRYFLDKTPRYYTVLEEIKQIFPDAKFIVLWRNPLGYLGSRFHSHANRWKVHHYKVDLYKGLESICDFTEKNSENICTVRYEDLVEKETRDACIARIFQFIDLDESSIGAEDFSKVELQGNVGDKTGVREYGSVSSVPVDKWMSTLCNPIRRRFARNYLEWIGEERLALMGYSKDQLVADIESIPSRYRLIFSDLYRSCYGILAEVFQLDILRKKINSILKNRKMYLHR